MTELKMKSEYASTKRRRYSQPAPTQMSTAQALSSRISRLGKKMKIENPLHVYNDTPAGFANFSTTGGLYDCLAQIVQGDNFTQRFGNKITVKRVMLRTTVVAGASAASAVSCRMALVRASYNLVAGRIDNTIISPTANTNITRVYWDKVFTANSPVGTSGFPVNFNLSIPVKFSAKFNGTGVNSVAAESIFLLWSANVATGAGAPVFGTGVIETWFSP